MPPSAQCLLSPIISPQSPQSLGLWVGVRDPSQLKGTTTTWEKTSNGALLCKQKYFTLIHEQVRIQLFVFTEISSNPHPRRDKTVVDSGAALLITFLLYFIETCNRFL